LISREIGDFLFNRRVLAFFRVNPAKSLNQSIYFESGALDFINRRVNPGKQEEGGCKKNRKIGEFSFRGISRPTTHTIETLKERTA